MYLCSFSHAHCMLALLLFYCFVSYECRTRTLILKDDDVDDDVDVLKHKTWKPVQIDDHVRRIEILTSLLFNWKTKGVTSMWIFMIAICIKCIYALNVCLVLLTINLRERERELQLQLQLYSHLNVNYMQWRRKMCVENDSNDWRSQLNFMDKLFMSS